MKKTVLFLLTAFLVLLSGCVLAEEETVTITVRNKSVTVPVSSEYADLGELSLRNRDDEYQMLDDFISALPNLKKLDMFSTNIPRRRIEHLAELFPEIEFGWTMVINCTNYTHPERDLHKIRTDTTAFSTLHNKYCHGHTEEDFSVLKYCRNLLALDIGHNRVSDLSFLYDLPNLKVLIVAINNQYLNDITPIGSLKDLEYLEIFHDDIHDISCLAGLEHLTDLNIAFNRITDYSPLLGLKNLRRLWMADSWSDYMPVPEDEVARLQEALPECRINAVSSPTEGGWREHPRYFTLNEMFNKFEYIPFTTLD